MGVKADTSCECWAKTATATSTDAILCNGMVVEVLIEWCRGMMGGIEGW